MNTKANQARVSNHLRLQEIIDQKKKYTLDKFKNMKFFTKFTGAFVILFPVGTNILEKNIFSESTFSLTGT